MRVLFTGATGFVGGHLAEALLRRVGCEPLGLSRQTDWPPLWKHLQNRVPLETVDWTESSLLNSLQQFRPDWVIHLAGYANAGASFREPLKAWDGNFTLTRLLYDAIQTWGRKPRILFVSSGLIYGDADTPGAPTDERTTLKPASPYATSKAAADLLSYQVTRHPGLDVVRARPFNHIGPKQSADYAAANFARQLAEIENGLRPPVLETGDLSSQRDLTDVRDVVQAYLRILEAAPTGEVFNVGSGTTYVIQSILDELVKLSRVKVEVRQRLDPSRKGDTNVTRADLGKIQSLLGWQPQIPLRQTLQDMLDDWRTRVA
jgi:GDP-4-dehydro-6-deoxy-D-mannose reductase